MPVVNLQIIRGLSVDQKHTLVTEITQTLACVADAKPASTHVVIQEMGDEDWGLKGRLVLDRRAAPPATA